MNEQTIFLGANSCRGFYSLYDEYIASLELNRLYVIKGGAGCGKSTLMRHIARRAEGQGEPVITVLCSGDPDSLDGVILPRRGAALFDGTAPHVLEPPLVGETGHYLDLSRFYTTRAEGLEPLTEGYREHYRRAYLFLSAAGSVEASEQISGETRDAIRHRARSLAGRSLPRRRGAGRGSAIRCFTDAFTCQGSISLPGTRRTLAGKLIALTGSPIRSDVFLRELLEAALERGCDAVICPDPLEPKRMAHLLLPELSLGFTTGEGDRRVHLEKLGAPLSGADKSSLREADQLRRALLHKAKKELSLAKLAHDRLEAAVHPHVDFPAVERTAEELADRILSD